MTTPLWVALVGAPLLYLSIWLLGKWFLRRRVSKALAAVFAAERAAIAHRRIAARRALAEVAYLPQDQLANLWMRIVHDGDTNDPNDWAEAFIEARGGE